MMLDKKFNNELKKLKSWVDYCTKAELEVYKQRVLDIAVFSNKSSYEILSEINQLLYDSQTNDIESVINYVGERYRCKRNNKWKTKHLGSWISKEDDSYMNNTTLSGWDILSASICGLVNNKFDKSTIKDVIFSNPATIVLWKDGTKTVVKCQDGDTYNKELGLAMCIIKKCCYNKGNFNDVFNEWVK